jgi:hypothetical protein
MLTNFAVFLTVLVHRERQRQVCLRKTPKLSEWGCDYSADRTVERLGKESVSRATLGLCNATGVYVFPGFSLPPNLADFRAVQFDRFLTLQLAHSNE